MINAGADFAAAVAQYSRRFRAKLYDGNTEVSGIVKSAKIHLGSTGPDKFYIGAVYSAYAEIVLDERNTTLEGKELRLDVGVLTDAANNVYTDITLGYFTALAPAATRYRTTFTAIGRIAAKLATESITFTDTKTLAQVAAMIATATGVTITFAAGIDTTTTINNAFDGTCREALTMLATACGGYATETNTGGILVSRYSDTATASFGPDTMQTLPEMAEYDFEITGVQAITPTGTYQDGNTINVVIEDNYITSDLFDDFSGGLIGFSYRPGTVHLALGDPRIEPTDVLTITTPYSESYTVPCMAVTHIFDGGFQTEVKTPAVQAVGKVVGAMSSAVKEATKTAEDAKKVAYNYLSRDATGIMVADMSDGTAYTPSTVPSGVKNTFIDDDSFDVRDGQTVLASFGEESQIGPDDNFHLMIYNDGLYLVSAEGKQLVKLGNVGFARRYITDDQPQERTSSAAPYEYIFKLSAQAVSGTIASVNIVNPSVLDPQGNRLSRTVDLTIGTASSSNAAGNHLGNLRYDGGRMIYIYSAEALVIKCSYYVDVINTCSLFIGQLPSGTTTNGDMCLNIGECNLTPYDRSVAIGRALKTSCAGQVAFGYANEADASHAFEIGNGSYDENITEDTDEYERDESVTRNVFAVGWDGDIEMALDVNAASSTIDGKLYAAITALGWESDVIV